MARIQSKKEATLSEVLAEVSLLDVGQMLKQTAAVIGCLAVIYAIVFGAIWVAGNVTGLGWADLGIPGWAFWLVIGWGYLWGATNERSFHVLHLEWYFPKLGWFSSFVLTAYIVGFVMLSMPVFEMEHGIERLIAGLLVWFGYLGPFTAFVSVINIGHKKLMEKRDGAVGV